MLDDCGGVSVTTTGRGGCAAGILGRDTHSRPAWTCRRGAWQLCAALHGAAEWVDWLHKQAMQVQRCMHLSTWGRLLDVTHSPRLRLSRRRPPPPAHPATRFTSAGTPRRFLQNAEEGAPRAGLRWFCPDPITPFTSPLTCVSSPPPTTTNHGPLLILNLDITTPTLCLHFSSIHSPYSTTPARRGIRSRHHLMPI